MFLRITTLALLSLLLSACGPKAGRPSFNTVRLTNQTKNEVAYAITLNGSAIPDITLKPKEGVLFYSTTPSLDTTKATMRNAQGEKMEFRGINMQLIAVRNGGGGISPSGIFSSFRYYNLEAAKAGKEPGWREMEAPEIRIIDIQILTEK